MKHNRDIIWTGIMAPLIILVGFCIVAWLFSSIAVGTYTMWGWL